MAKTRFIFPIFIMDKGVEIARYESVDAFVNKHKEGLYAIGRLEENMHKILERQQITLSCPLDWRQSSTSSFEHSTRQRVTQEGSI